MHSKETIIQMIQALKFQEGEVLLFDKPMDWSSFDVVNKVRYQIKILTQAKCKVGHAGTLDPKATGLLILCTGKMTKQIDNFQGLPKTYTGTLKLGATTPSYDAEQAENATFPTEHITEEAIYEGTEIFIGDIDQTVPIFSALKVDGKRMYKLARAGKEVRTRSRVVHIDTFKITGIEMPYVHFEVHCGKGTYIRSLAHDFGKALGSGAYLTSLRRTKIGDHKIEDAWVLKDFVDGVLEIEKG